MKPLSSKLTRPRVDGVVERQRLLKRLDLAAEKGTIWLSAPAGSGKTTLVADWLERRKRPCLWYQADEGDRDIASFFSYMGQAVVHVAPRYRTPLPLFTPEYRLGLPSFTKRFFETLFSRVKPPFCFVLDNYQEVPPDSLFHEVVRDGAALAPDGVYVVVVSRSDPPSIYSRVQAQACCRMVLIEKDDIWFTFDESRRLVKSREKIKTPEKTIRSLYDTTRGWAAGLVLLSGSAVGLEAAAGLATASTEKIFDYFALELFDRAEAETREFLLTSAYLPNLTVEAASELTGFQHAEKVLSGLNRRNFFIQRRETPAIVYEYHPLFRGFLMIKAGEAHTRERADAIRKKAAQILIKSGQPEEAVKLLMDAADWTGLIALIHESAASLIAAGRFLTIGDWINRIPADIVEQNGWVLYWKAMCRLSTRPSEAREYLEKAYLLFQQHADASGAFLSWAGIVDTFVYEWRDFRPLDRWIDEFDGLLRKYGGFHTREIEVRLTSAIFAALMFRQPHHPDMKHWEERVLSLMEKTEDPTRRISIGSNLVLYFLWTGRFNESEALIATLAPGLQSAKMAPLPYLMWLRSEALHYFYVTRPEQGLETLRKGLRIAGETGIHTIDLMFYGTGIYHAAVIGDAVLAREFLDKMSTALEPGSCYAAIYHATQSGLAFLMQEKPVEAVAMTEKGLRLAAEAGVPLIVFAYQAQMAFILLETNNLSRARPYLDNLRKTEGVAHSVAWSAAFEAQIALHEGNDAVFAEHFSIALAFSKTNGLRFFSFSCAVCSRMCAKALELGLEKDLVKEFIKQRKLAPPDPAPDSWPWPVRIKTLGGFELFVDDRPVVFPGRVQQKPLALLKLLVAFGGRDVPEERITDALWPEADGDSAHQSFDTTLHRLRKVIGNDRTIMVSEGRVSLNRQYCSIDTQMFEKTADAAMLDDGSQALLDPAKLERAVSLYRGHFLPADTKEPWTISIRERLRAKFTLGTSELGQYWMDRGKYDHAVRILLRGLEVDDLAEVFYQRLMVSYHQLGQETEAVKTYNRCKQVLMSSLGLTPSSRTEGIYYAIRQREPVV